MRHFYVLSSTHSHVFSHWLIRKCKKEDLRSSDETSRRRWVTEQTVKKTMVKTTLLLNRGEIVAMCSYH
ncbi:hypothetical protein Bca101_050552 [Brassica carinata]